jgi:phage tail sheath protein FI
MPGPYRYPGVYVEEIPSSVRPITGVSTSDTAFVDFFARGPLDQASRITSWADFERRFGGLDRRSEASYAIHQYYLNGGSVAWVIRVADGAASASLTLQDGAGNAALEVAAASPGTWGNGLVVAVDHATSAADGFNVVVRELVTTGTSTQVAGTETFRNLSMDPMSPRFVERVVDGASALVRVTAHGATRPAATAAEVTGPRDAAAERRIGTTDAQADAQDGVAGTDGAAPGAAALAGTAAAHSGFHALDAIAPDVFNLLCIPAAAGLADGDATGLLADALAYCKSKRAFLLVDPPADLDDQTTPSGAMTRIRAYVTTLEGAGLRDPNAALYFPRLTVIDPLDENRPRRTGPSGTLAGVYARTDSTRGVWKAPAGTESSLRGASVATPLTDDDNGGLNPLGINVLRTFPVFGSVSWGARTLDGADQRASEWKYVPVRRTALYLEESLYEGLRWVVFEPNDEPLWAQIRLNVGAFMHNLFRQGAFQGATPRDAYLVKCDAETTTQNDIDLGIVNILVGFAPLKPAEFVILRIQQMTRPSES